MKARAGRWRRRAGNRGVKLRCRGDSDVGSKRCQTWLCLHLMVKCKFLRVQNSPEEIAENFVAFVGSSERFLNGGDFFLVGGTIEGGEKNGFGKLRVIFAAIEKVSEPALLVAELFVEFLAVVEMEQLR